MPLKGDLQNVRRVHIQMHIFRHLSTPERSQKRASLKCAILIRIIFMRQCLQEYYRKLGGGELFSELE